MQHIRDYFARREAEMASLSLTADTEPFVEFRRADGTIDGTRGRMFARLSLSERSFLQVNEQVIVQHGRKHRTSYAYYLIVDGAEVWAYERDPTHDPAEHRHDSTHQRFPSDSVSFRWAAEKAWQTFADTEGLSPEEG